MEQNEDFLKQKELIDKHLEEQLTEILQKQKSLKKLNPIKDKIVNAVLSELEKAEAKFSPFNSAHEGYAVLKEEVDELWDVVKMQQSNPERIPKMRKEAIQVAAMSLRFLLMLEDSERAKR